MPNSSTGCRLNTDHKDVALVTEFKPHLHKLDMAVRDTLDRLHKDHTAENDEIDTLFHELAVKRGSTLKRTMFSRLVKP